MATSSPDHAERLNPRDGDVADLNRAKLYYWLCVGMLCLSFATALPAIKRRRENLIAWNTELLITQQRIVGEQAAIRSLEAEIKKAQNEIRTEQR